MNERFPDTLQVACETVTTGAGEAIVVRLSGELVITTTQPVRDAIEAAIRSGEGPPRIVVDCSVLEYIDTPGLAFLLRLTRRCRLLGGELAVAGIPGRFGELLEKLHLPSHLTLDESVAASVERLGS